MHWEEWSKANRTEALCAGNGCTLEDRRYGNQSDGDETMRDRVGYEWTVEFYDEHGDIHDIDRRDDFESAAMIVKEFEPHFLDSARIVKVDFCLVKRWGNDADGETERGYAYITENDGEWSIEEYFDDGSSVNKSHRRTIQGRKT